MVKKGIAMRRARNFTEKLKFALLPGSAFSLVGAILMWYYSTPGGYHDGSVLVVLFVVGYAIGLILE